MVTHRTRRPPVPALVDPASAEAWDAWFRLRDGSRPIDLDIGDTWRRVASTLALGDDVPETAAPAFAAALEAMQVLPDPRILATAGSACCEWPAEGFAASLNLATMVRDPFTPQARFDYAGLTRLTELAARMLDAGARLAGSAEPATRRIGVIGFADALLMLRIRYASADAAAVARQIGDAVAAGCRSGTDCVCARHVLIVLEPQPRLALLANNVADGLDPLRGERARLLVESGSGARMLQSSGSTLTRYRRLREAGAISEFPLDTAANVDVSARDALHAALRGTAELGVVQRCDDSVQRVHPL